MQYSLTKYPHIEGFSLVEILVVIAILGILASIGIANFSGGQRQVMIETRDRRNAQELAAVYLTAQSAGLDFTVLNDLDATVQKIITGGTPSSGAFSGRYFSVQGLQAADAATAKRYLLLQGNSLIYVP